MIMIKLSFLISLYNGALYLEKCLDSLLHQNISYDLYDIICVDDCSSDNTCEIIEKYQSIYPNVILIKNETNNRLASNVNKLVELTSAPYFWLVDQDDYIEPTCLQKIFDALDTEAPDVLLFNYRLVKSDESIIDNISLFRDTTKENGIEFVKTEFADRDYCQYIMGYKWRAIFRTDMWKKCDIRCVAGMNYDDTVIVPKAILLANKIVSMGDIFYNYRQNTNSMTYSSSFVKKGNYIFEFAFLVGNEIETFYNQLQTIDIELSELLYKHLQKRYNNFVIDLIRTSRQQKRVFYQILRENALLVNKKKHWLNWSAKLLVSRSGYVLSIVGEWIYKLKKMMEHKI